MPKVTVTQPHSLPIETAKERLQALADRLSAKYGISARWVSHTQAAVSRTGVTGTITVTSSQVTVALDLSFVLSPLKQRVENRVAKELRTALAAESG